MIANNKNNFNIGGIDIPSPLCTIKQTYSIWKTRAVEWIGLADFSEAYEKCQKKAYKSALKSAGLGSLRLGSIVAKCPLPFQF